MSKIESVKTVKKIEISCLLKTLEKKNCILTFFDRIQWSFILFVSVQFNVY